MVLENSKIQGNPATYSKSEAGIGSPKIVWITRIVVCPLCKALKVSVFRSSLKHLHDIEVRDDVICDDCLEAH